MTGEGEYGLVLTAPARSELTDRLPEAVATAVIDFLSVSSGAGAATGGQAAAWRARRDLVGPAGDLPDSVPDR